MKKFLTQAVALVAVLGFATAVHAQLLDVTAPGDAISPVDLDGTVGSSPASGNEDALHAIDNVTQKYLNFGEPAGADSELNTGFIVTPTLGATVGGTIVSGLRLFTANDAVERDPASLRLEGSSSAAGPWTLIFEEDMLALPGVAQTEARNAGGLVPIDPATHFHQELMFDNTTPYLSYRLVFPTVKNSPAAANSMQIAEVEFLGVAVPEPSTFVLMSAGLAGLVLAARRRRAG